MVMSQRIVTQSSFSVGVVDEIQLEDVVDPFCFFLFSLFFRRIQEIIFLFSFSFQHFRTFKDEVLLAFTEVDQSEPFDVNMFSAFKFYLSFVAAFCVKD
jgi:hypothetical protein